MDEEFALLAADGESGEDGSKGDDEDEDVTGRMSSIEEGWDEGEEGLSKGYGRADELIVSSSCDGDSCLELAWVEFCLLLACVLSEESGENLGFGVGRSWRLG